MTDEFDVDAKQAAPAGPDAAPPAEPMSAPDPTEADLAEIKEHAFAWPAETPHEAPENPPSESFGWEATEVPAPPAKPAVESAAPAAPEEEPVLVSAEDAVLEPAATAPVEGAVREAEAESGEDVSISDAGDTILYSAKQTKRARDVLTRLSAVRRAARFYPADHPAVQEGVALLHDAIHYYHEEGVDLQFAFFEGELLLGSKLLAEESVLFDQLIRDLTAIGVGSLIFVRGLTKPELARAVVLLASDTQEVERNGGIEHMVAEAEIPDVKISAIRALGQTRDGELADGETVEGSAAAFGSAVALMREMDRLFRAGHPVSSTKIKGVVRSLVDNVLSNRYAMLQLTGLKNYDEYTFYHSANVAILSLALGSCITNDYRFLSSLGAGALLHDIGKMAVALEVLNKPGPLTPDEWANVRQHPVSGAEMTALLPGIDKAAIVVILEHHMRWDATGYPTRNPRRKQHLASRIVAVADSYDAMTSRRSYSAARVQDEAMLLLAKSAGSALDPTLVRLFVSLMGLYPPRSVVRLSDASVGIVLAPSPEDPFKPVVRIVTAPDGSFITPEDVELVQRPDLTVNGCLDPRLLNIEVEDYV